MTHTPTRKLSFLSFVIPVYNEEATLPYLRDALTPWLDALPDIKVEALLVNDGSTDRSFAFLEEWGQTDGRIKVISFSRNFGHQAAVTAGLAHAAGEAVVIIDADLQDPLNVVKDMIARYEEGYDVAYGKRIEREGETSFKRGTAWIFYRLMQRCMRVDMPADAGDFRLVSRQCVDAINAMPETHRFLRGMFAWVGFSQIAVPYVRDSRKHGETKYPLRKMMALAWNGITSFSAFPIRLVMFCGLLTALLGGIAGIYALFSHFSGNTVAG